LKKGGEKAGVTRSLSSLRVLTQPEHPYPLQTTHRVYPDPSPCQIPSASLSRSFIGAIPSDYASDKVLSQTHLKAGFLYPPLDIKTMIERMAFDDSNRAGDSDGARTAGGARKRRCNDEVLCYLSLLSLIDFVTRTLVVVAVLVRVCR